MSFLQKINIFSRPTPDQLLTEWVIARESRRAKSERIWRKSNNMQHFSAKEWATLRDLDKLVLILDAGAHVDRFIEPRKGYGDDDEYEYRERPLLDAMLRVSGAGALMLIQRGAIPTQETVKVLHQLTDGYRGTRTNSPVKNSVFDFEDVAREMIKTPGLNWYYTYPKHYTVFGNQRCSATVTEVDIACHRSFKSALEEEQKKRGWPVGPPSFSQLLLYKGQIHMSSLHQALASAVAGEEELLGGERDARIDELIEMGADPNGVYRLKSDKTISLVGFAIQNRHWTTADRLMSAGGKMDWDLCEQMFANWVCHSITPRGNNADPQERGRVRWKVNECLKAVAKHEMPDWGRPFPFVKPEGVKYSQAQEKMWPRTWGALMDYLGDNLRQEIEQIHLAAITPKTQATPGSRRL